MKYLKRSLLVIAVLFISVFAYANIAQARLDNIISTIANLTITGTLTANTINATQAYISTILSASNLVNGGVVFSTSSGYLTNGVNFYWDAVNSRLGIGTSTPSDKLEIVGGGLVLPYNTNGIQFRNSSGAPTTMLSYGLATANTLYLGANKEFTSNGNSIMSPPSGGQAIITGGIADGPTAVANIINTRTTYTSTTAKILSIRNLSTEKVAFDYNGNIIGGTYFLRNTTAVAGNLEVLNQAGSAWGTVGTMGLELNAGGAITATRYQVYRDSDTYNQLHFNVPTSSGGYEFSVNDVPMVKIATSTAGSAGKAMCWKADGVTLGYCSSLVGVSGDCTCN